MALYDTSNTIDNSIFLKSKLKKNMVGDNYFIENLQEKRNQDWEYRYNLVDIEEELLKQTKYTQSSIDYTPIEAVITNVKSDTGDDMGTDWAHLAFKNLKHPCGEGYRYRFSLDFPDMKSMSEEDKHYNTSVWICVNKSPIRAGNSCTVHRCNTALAFLGSPTLDGNNVTEVHYEPCILENDLKYTQVYYNSALPVPQSEWYATMQLNYFTDFIKINNRFVFTTTSSEDRENNQIYKVKAIIKSTTEHTFVKDEQSALKDTPLIIVALDKDMVNPDDDIENRIANSAPVYKTFDIDPVYEYYFKAKEPYVDKIILGQTENYEINIYYNEKIVDNTQFNFTVKLNGIIEKNWGNYFEFIQTGQNTFSVKNLKACNRGNLVITAKWINPPTGATELSEDYSITLGGFY